MSPKSVQQKSIKDHFSIIPKEKVEPKVYPLFLKRKAPVKNKVENTTIPTPILPPPATPIPKKQQLVQPKKTITPPVKRKCSRVHPLQELIKANTSHYFQKQKTIREEQFQEKKEKPCTAQNLFDRNSIENWMNEYYPKWRKEPCCEYLYTNIPALTNDNRIQWVNKYRPNEIEGLIGFLPDFQYVKEWLDKIKVKCNYDTTSKEEQSKTKRKKPTMSKNEDKLYNLILFIGDHGTGKTATAYTVAQEMGYSVFEINTTSRRAGKDILNQVGEMTASHLVRFNHRKRKNKGEIIILRDTVVNKKPKTIDIATHFKRMLTVSNNNSNNKDEDENKKSSVIEEDVTIEQVQTTEKIKKSGSIDSFFQRSNLLKKTNSATEKDKNIAVKEEVGKSITIKEKEQGERICEEVKDEQQEQNTIIEVEEEQQQEEEEEDTIMEDAPKQSLVLLEEVDLLFEEDKGFWTAVIELCQKSKRPIIMTCNDESKVPFDHLDIQSKIYFDLPEKSSLLPYLQLLCFSERYIVKPYDIEYLCELYNYDTRRIITELQFYLNPHGKDEYVQFPVLFARIMGFDDLIGAESSKSLVVLMDRLKGSSEKTKVLCMKYFKQSSSNQEEKEEEISLDTICEMMETASFADAWIGLTDRQRHQIYDIDQYDDETDMIVSTNDNFIYKNSTDLDHWELGEIIENSISVMNLNRKSLIWSNHMSAWSSHWEHLYDTSVLVNCIKQTVCPLILSNPCYIGSLRVFMMEYMPNIRSICLNDENIALKARSTRKKTSRYIKLDDESRDIINWQQI